jgi:hypothetical protein
MYCVFWKFTHEGETHTLSQEFAELGPALGKCEALRGEGMARFITMGHDNPNMVGKQGVAEPSPDYHWPKRRSTELRKDVK